MSNQMTIAFEESEGVVRARRDKGDGQKGTAPKKRRASAPKATKPAPAEESPKIFVGLNPALMALLPGDFLTMPLGEPSGKGSVKMERVVEVTDSKTVGVALSVGPEQLNRIPRFGEASLLRWWKSCGDLARLGRIAQHIRSMDDGIQVPGTPYSPIDSEASTVVGYDPRAVLTERGAQHVACRSFDDSLPSIAAVLNERPRIRHENGTFSMKVPVRKVLGSRTIPLFAWLVLHRLASHESEGAQHIHDHIDMSDPRSTVIHGGKGWNRLRYDDRFASRLAGVPRVKSDSRSFVVSWSGGGRTVSNLTFRAEGE